MFRRPGLRMMRRRRRRRLIVGGMVVIGASNAMVKMSHQQAEQIQQATGKNPEDMDEDELNAAMAQQGITPQPVTAEDQQAMEQAEANDPPEEEA